MSLELVVALIGLGGAVVGGVLSTGGAMLSERARAGRESKPGSVVAARLTRQSLSGWSRASFLATTAPTRLQDKGDDYDIYLAIEVRSMLEFLDRTWLKNHEDTLAVVSTLGQWDALLAAGQATDGLVSAMESIGDAGREAMQRRSTLLREARTALPATNTDAPDDSYPVIAELDKRSRVIERDLESHGERFRELAIQVKTHNDYRLFLVRDVVKSIVGAKGKIDAALAACTQVEAGRGD